MFELIPSAGVPVKAWIRGVPLEEEARRQLLNVAQLDCVFHHVAAMPDVHWGIGATVGSVIATRKAIIPAAVGVDLGCGMMAVCTSLRAEDLPENLGGVRRAIEEAVPHGRTAGGGRGDEGAWRSAPDAALEVWKEFEPRYRALTDRHPGAAAQNTARHLGTLGTGNHFIEICLDEAGAVWALLHSGSRGMGNRIGTYFIERARREMQREQQRLPDMDLAYLREGSALFEDYADAVELAQSFARANRELMMQAVLRALERSVRPFHTLESAVNCHHNYVQRERHFGADVYVTRKGAVSARAGELGIIPGSMGARSYIVRGKGNPESFHSCSHGAGRRMSRGEAKRRFSLQDHERATQGVECRKDAAVIDETPAAYKDIDAVMRAQEDLVEAVHTLKQVVCVKG